MHRTIWQAADSEGVVDAVARLSVAPTLQAGVLLLVRLEYVVTAQTLQKEIRNSSTQQLSSSV